VTYLARVVVMLKPVVNDPQGLTVRSGLHSLGFEAVEDVRIGKHIEVRLSAESEEAARDLVAAMCRKLLANHVIEDVRFLVEEDKRVTTG
jgi:phosphoribosylformylglycinamidine synthase